VHKKVPVLVHNGKPVCESRIIVEYIDEAFPDSGGAALLPPADDPYERATARFWAAFIDDKLVHTWVQSFRGKTAEEKAEAAARTRDAVATLEAAFADPKRKPFFGGDAVGLVDIVLGGVVSWVPATAALHGTWLFDAERTPHLDAWLKRFAALEEVRAVAPDANDLVAYAKKREAELAAEAAAAGGGK
jgi:glutathione S-transferase